ncbi:hypothetical protein AMTRI_Chr06g198170 [Amborella trichopoda]
MYVESNTPISVFSYWAYKNHFSTAELLSVLILHFSACIYHGVHIVINVEHL